MFEKLTMYVLFGAQALALLIIVIDLLNNRLEKNYNARTKKVLLTINTVVCVIWVVATIAYSMKHNAFDTFVAWAGLASGITLVAWLKYAKTQKN